jgi:hypothetical protein
MLESNSNLIWGAAAIAREIGRSLRATFHLLEKGHLPARKVGAAWVADREVLKAFFRGEDVAA